MITRLLLFERQLLGPRVQRIKCRPCYAASNSTRKAVFTEGKVESELKPIALNMSYTPFTAFDEIT